MMLAEKEHAQLHAALALFHFLPGEPPCKPSHAKLLTVTASLPMLGVQNQSERFYKRDCF